MNYHIAYVLLVSILQTVSADSEVLPSPPVEKFRELVCENDKLVLSCQYGYTIDIITVTYGKTNSIYCAIKDSKVNNCSAGKALDIVKLKCNRKETCTINATNQVFGDPCVGTIKYLDVEYECIAGDVQISTVCENEDLDIKCPDGSYLSISNAIYGRISPVSCTGPHKNVKTLRCKSDKSLAVIESKCDNVQQCKVKASNQIFGDPCPGTVKYLQVNYQCLNRDAF